MPSKSRPLKCARIIGLLDFAIGLQRGHAIRGQQQLAFFGLDDHVFIVGVKRQPAVVRNRPRGGGPDHRRNIGPNSCGFVFSAADAGERHPDRRAGVIFVLHFGFGQRGVVVNAPVDRLASAIDVALFHELQERAGDGGLVPRLIVR